MTNPEEIFPPQDLGTNYPIHDLDPKKKETKEWSLKCLKWLYQEAIGEGTYQTMYDKRDDFIMNRLYAQGRQPVDKYMDWYSTPDETGARKGYANLNFDIRPIIPRFRDSVLGFLSTQKFDVIIDAIDSYSKDMKNAEAMRMWAEKMLRKKFEEIEKEAGGKLDNYQPKFLPESMEELNLYLENRGLRLPEEIAFTEAVNLCLYVNNWIEELEKVDEDLFDLGIAGTKVYTDGAGRIRLRACDMVNTFPIGKKERKTIKTAVGIGEFINITISDLKEDAGNTFTEEEYIEIANAYSGENGNQRYTYSWSDYNEFINTDEIGGYPWDGQHIIVFDAQWDSDDPHTKYKRYRNKEDDVGRLYDKEHGYKPPKKDRKDKRNKVEVTRINTKYQGKWIVGTDFVYDYGKVTDIVDSPTDIARTEFDYTIYRSHDRSILERMIPSADDFQLNELKIQNAKAMARPKGVQIDVNTIESINYGGEVLPKKEVIKLYNQTGNLLYDSSDHYDIDNPFTGGGSRPSPVIELEGGLGRSFQELAQERNNILQQIRDLTGLNAIFDASTPDKDQLVGTAQMAYNATINSLRPIVDAREKIHGETFRKIARKLQIISKFGGLEAYKDAIGGETVQVIKMNNRIPLMQMSIQVKAQPNDQDKQELMQAALQAMKSRAETGQGGIELPDYLFIKDYINDGNLKLAEALLSHRINKQRQRDLQEAMMRDRNKAQADMKSNQAATKNEVMKKRSESQNEMVKEKLKSFLRQQEQNNKDRNQAMLEGIKHGYDLEKIAREYDRKDEQLMKELNNQTKLKEMELEAQENSEETKES